MTLGDLMMDYDVDDVLVYNSATHTYTPVQKVRRCYSDELVDIDEDGTPIYVPTEELIIVI